MNCKVVLDPHRNSNNKQTKKGVIAQNRQTLRQQRQKIEEKTPQCNSSPDVEHRVYSSPMFPTKTTQQDPLFPPPSDVARAPSIVY